MKLINRSSRDVWPAMVLAAFGAVLLAGADPVRIAFFANSSFVDTSGTTSGEVTNLTAALNLYDCTIEHFTAYDAASLSTVLSDADILLIPEQENGGLAGSLTAAAATVISNFVDSGHGMIIFGQSSSNDEALLNALFGFSLLSGSTSSSASKTAAAVDTPFEAGPASLPENNGTYEWMLSSLPPDGLSIYDTGTYVSVAQLAVGYGKVVFLGYDWFDAYPRGSQDNGWHATLGYALEAAGVRPLLTVTLPAIEAVEGDGLLELPGYAGLPEAVTNDVVIYLEAANPAELSVPGWVTIPAGETNAPFSLTVLNDAVVDGSQQVEVIATSERYAPGSAFLTVHDDETANLSLSLPYAAFEGGTVVGTVHVDPAPAADVTVMLLPGAPFQLGTGTVVIAQGQSFAQFSVPVVDDNLIEGLQTATLTPHVRNWTGVPASIFVYDNEQRILTLQLPAAASEGDGTLTNAGSISVSGILTGDLTVALSSSSPDIGIPAQVFIPAGQSNALFDLTINDNSATDGARQATVYAQSPDYIPASDTITIRDNDLHHLLLDGPVGDVALLQPVSVTVSALTSDDQPVAGFAGPVTLAAAGDRGAIGVTPDVLTNFVDGAGSGSLVFDAIGNDVLLVAESGGFSVTGAPFNVVAPRISITPAELTDTLVVAGETATRTLVISNTGNAALEFQIQNGGSVDPGPADGLVAWYPFNGDGADASGNGHDGTVSGGLTYTDGVVGQAAVFNGSNARIQVPHSTDLNLDGPFSLSCWIKSSRTAAASGLLAKIQSGSPRNGYILTANATLTPADVQINIDRNWPDVKGIAYTTNSVLDGEWHHIAATYDEETISFYVDGRAEMQVAYTNGLTVNTLPLYIGWDPYASDRYFKGQMDEVRIYSRALSASEVDALYAVALPSEGLLARYPFSGNADDTSGNGHDGTVHGATLTADRFGHADSAYHFDGTAGYIDLGSMGGFQSVSMWVRPDARTDYDFYFGHDDFRIYASILENGRLSFGDGSGSITTTAQMDSLQGAWHHLVAVSDGAASRIYLDGVNVTSVGRTLGTVTADAVNLGRWPGGTHYFNGDLDDVNVYDRVLADDEILALFEEGGYEGGGGTTNAGGLVAWYPFSGNAADASGNGYDGTLNGPTLSPDRFGNADSAYYFDGVNDRLDLPGNVLEFDGSDAFTHSFWMNTTDTDSGGNVRGLLSKMVLDAAINGYFTFMDSGALFVYLMGDLYVNDALIVQVPAGVNDGQWHHVAIAYDGSTSAAGITVYVDGTAASSSIMMDELSSSILNTAGSTAGYAADIFFYEGLLDDIRIYDRELSAAEIAGLTAETPETGLVAHYPLDGDAVDLSSNGYDGTLNGATPAADRFGNPGGACYFDGVDDRIDLPSTVMDVDRTNTFSQSFWIRTSSTSVGPILAKFEPVPPLQGLMTYMLSGQISFFMNSDTTGNRIYVNFSGSINDDAWHHVALTYDGSSAAAGLSVYVDGALAVPVVGTDALTGSIRNTIAPIIGDDGFSTAQFEGYLDEMRIYDRVLSASEVADLYGGGVSADPATADRVLADTLTGLVASYAFDGDATDASGNAYDGIVHGAVLTSNRFGRADSAYRFDGLNDRIDLPSEVLNFERTDAYTKSFWMKTTETDTGNNILAKIDSTSAVRGLNIALNSGQLTVHLINYNPSLNRITVQGDAFVNNGQWHHVALTYDGSSTAAGLHLYVDGAETGLFVFEDALTGTILNSVIPTIGSRNLQNYYGGALDDVRIYNRALSEAEVLQLYNETDGVAWLSAEPASGTVLPGESVEITVTFDASELGLGEYASNSIVVTCNDPLSAASAVAASMWGVPGAPVMDPEPEFTAGTSNAVSWSALDGEVSYLVEISADTNAAALADSGWIDRTDHAFLGLSTDTTYYYHVRASVASTIGPLAGPWSAWVSSTQGGGAVDGDGDGLPDWWEDLYLGGTASGWDDDADGDGQSNGDEYVSGMNPTNPVSRFIVQTYEPSTNGGFVVTWDAVTGRVYSVHWTSELTNLFEAVETNLHYPRSSYTDEVHQVEGQGFYKVEVELE